MHPFAEQGTCVSGVDNLLDAEVFGGAKRGADGVQTCANLLEEGCGVIAAANSCQPPFMRSPSLLYATSVAKIGTRDEINLVR